MQDLMPGQMAYDDDDISIETFAEHVWMEEVLEATHHFSDDCKSATSARIFVGDPLEDLPACLPLLTSCGVTITIDDTNDEYRFFGFVPDLFTRVYSSGHTMLIDSEGKRGVGMSFLRACDYERVRSIPHALYPNSGGTASAEFGPFRLMAPHEPLYETPASSKSSNFIRRYSGVFVYCFVVLSSFVLSIVIMYLYEFFVPSWVHLLFDCLWVLVGCLFWTILVCHLLIRKLCDQGQQHRLKHLMNGRPGSFV